MQSQMYHRDADAEINKRNDWSENQSWINYERKTQLLPDAETGSAANDFEEFANAMYSNAIGILRKPQPDWWLLH